MTISLDVGELAEQTLFAGHELTQFEPDPDGDGGHHAAPSPAPDEDDLQWVVFPDAAEEAAWAATEQLGWTPP